MARSCHLSASPRRLRSFAFRPPFFFFFSCNTHTVAVCTSPSSVLLYKNEGLAQNALMPSVTHFIIAVIDAWSARIYGVIFTGHFAASGVFSLSKSQDNMSRSQLICSIKFLQRGRDPCILHNLTPSYRGASSTSPLCALFSVDADYEDGVYYTTTQSTSQTLGFVAVG